MPAKTVSGASFFYEEAGKGEQGGPVVLLHGFPLDSRIWTSQRAELSNKYRVITPELRGFGRSQSNESFTMESLADDVHALLTEIGALPCVLGGLSMGGYVALEYVRKYPTDLRGLMLIDTKAEGDTPEGKEARVKMAQLAKDKGSAAVAEQMMPKMLAPEADKHRPAVAKELREIMEACPPATIVNALMAMRDRKDHSSNLPSIALPTLILVGEADAITPPKMAEAMKAGIPRAELHVIRGAGHMSPMEQPQQVNQAMRGFLDGIKHS